jgi:hypothetical protein
VALVPETGAGLANADAYDSIAGVTTTLTKYGEETAWLALASDTVREQVARKAFRRMNTEPRYRGTKKTAAQAGEWPRVYAYDDDGYSYPDDEVPSGIKEAFAQFCAEGSVAGADLQPNETTPGTIKSEAVSIGPISESITYESAKSPSVYYRKAQSLLRELVEPGGILERA